MSRLLLARIFHRLFCTFYDAIVHPWGDMMGAILKGDGELNGRMNRRFCRRGLGGREGLGEGGWEGEGGGRGMMILL